MRLISAKRWVWTGTAVFWLALPACRQEPVRPLAPAVPPAPPPVEEPTRAHLLGVWMPTEKNAADAGLTFQPNGSAVFRGTLSYYNPVFWRLDLAAKELALTLPQAANEKLDIFHMQIGKGVKAFDRKAKQVTFAFDANTHALNIAGWTYEKPSSATVTATPDEPTLR